MKRIKTNLYILLSFLTVIACTTSCVETEINDYGSIHGTIQNAVNGEALSNVAVTLTPGGKTTVTGSDGSYQYIDLTPGEYTVQAQSSGFQSNSKSVTVEAGVISRCDIQLMSGSGSIHGTIKNAVNGEALSNVAVTLTPGGRTTVTGSDGSYQYINITPGEYTVQAQSNGFQSNSKSVTVEAGAIGRCDIQLMPGNGVLFIQNPNAQFGLSSTSQSVLLRNTGTDRIDWTVDYNCNWIVAVTPASGSIDANGSATLTIRIDRSRIPDNSELSTIVMVNSTGGNAPIYVSANGSMNTGDASGVVPNGLYAYYTFEDNSRSVVGGPNASIVNPLYMAGAADGTKSVVLNSQSILNIPEGVIDKSEFAVSFWIKGMKNGHLFHVQTNASNSSGKNNSFTLTVNNSGNLHFIVQNYNYWYPSYNKIPAFNHNYLNATEWHHITLSSEFGKTQYARCNTKLYINGEYADMVSEEVNPYDKKDYGAGIKFTMGGDLYDLEAISGMNVDNLRFYQRQLTDDEVAQIYLAERGY